MTQINTLIKENPVSPAYDFTLNDNIAMNISTELNKLWDPAWNVVIISTPANIDSVLYGYAFRGHWLWFNGLPNPGDGNHFMGYVIWKDYNCIGWVRLNLTSINFSQ